MNWPNSLLILLLQNNVDNFFELVLFLSRKIQKIGKAMAFSKTVQKKCYRLYIGGMSAKDITKETGVPPSTLSQWKKKENWNLKAKEFSEKLEKTYWDSLINESKEVTSRYLNISKLLGVLSQQQLTNAIFKLKELAATHKRLGKKDTEHIRDEKLARSQAQSASKLAHEGAQIFKLILPTASSNIAEDAIEELAKIKEKELEQEQGL